MSIEQTGPSRSTYIPIHSSDTVLSSNEGEIGAGSILAHSANVVFTGAPVFWSVQGSYITGRGNSGQQRPPLALDAVNDLTSGTHDTRRDIADPSGVQPFIRQMSGEDSDNPPKGKGRAQLYRQLDKEKLGIALHIPQPNARLSQAARRKGVCIGSVGKVTPERSFDYMFNIFYDASDPINPPDLQAGAFTPIEPALSSHDIREFREFSSGSYVATAGIHREKLRAASPRTMATFACDSNEGALLYMPEGAYYEKLTNRARLDDYLALHGPSLYEYVNSTRSRQLRNGELSVVFSCRKATSWGIATFQNAPTERATQLEFIKKEQAEAPSAGSRYMWDCCGAVQAKVGPEEENDDLGMDGDDTQISSLRNQCLFVRALKIKLSEDVWERTFPAKSVVIGSFDDEVSPYEAPASTTTSLSFSPSPSFSPPPSGDFGCAESLPTSFSQRDSDSLNISDRSSGDEDYNDYITTPPDDFQRLSDMVTDFLLDKKSAANVAIASDRDWSSCKSLDREASEILDDICAYNDICERNGTVYFEPKEHFLSKSQQEDIAKGLANGDIPFPVYLFGREDDSPSDRCNWLDTLINALRDGPNFPAPSGFHVRPMLLQGHPLRVLSLDNAATFASDSYDPLDPSTTPLTIPSLRKKLNLALSSNSGAAIHCGQQLGAALIRRFWNLCHEDDLYEAIWVLRDTLHSITTDCAYIYRCLEILLDLSTAFFFRFQLLRCSEDLQALLSLLEKQKDVVVRPELRWIWQKGCQERSSNVLRLRLFASPTRNGSVSMSDIHIARIFRPSFKAENSPVRRTERSHDDVTEVSTDADISESPDKGVNVDRDIIVRRSLPPHGREIELPPDESAVTSTHGLKLSSSSDRQNDIIEWKGSSHCLYASPCNEDLNATLHGSSESLMLRKTAQAPINSTKRPVQKHITLIFKRVMNALRLSRSKSARSKSALPSIQQRLHDHRTVLVNRRYDLTGFNSHSPAISDNTLYDEVRSRADEQ